MALTRAMLKGMGLTEEQVGAIIEEHTAVTGALKEQIKEYKADAEQLPVVQKELDKLKDGGDTWKEKYENEHKAFEDYKKDTAAKETARNIKSAYRKLLEAENVDSKRIDTIMRATVFDGMELDSDGKLKDADKLSEGIKSEWGDFIVTESKRSEDPAKPPKQSEPNGANPKAAEIAKRFYAQHGGIVKE